VCVCVCVCACARARARAWWLCECMNMCIHVYIERVHTHICHIMHLSSVYVCITCICVFTLSRKYARTFMLRYSLLLSYKSTKKKLSSHTMRRNVLYVCIRIPTHCKHIIPLEGSKSTWSNNNKITPEYISQVYIFSRICRALLGHSLIVGWVNVGWIALRPRFFSAFPVDRTLGRVPSLPFLRHSNTSLSNFIAVTWPKEFSVFASVVYCCCVVIRGDPIEETSSSHKAPLEPSFSSSSSSFSSSSYKHVDIRKVFQSAFLERCNICL